MKPRYFLIGGSGDVDEVDEFAEDNQPKKDDNITPEQIDDITDENVKELLNVIKDLNIDSNIERGIQQIGGEREYLKKIISILDNNLLFNNSSLTGSGFTNEVNDVMDKLSLDSILYNEIEELFKNKVEDMTKDDKKIIEKNNIQLIGDATFTINNEAIDDSEIAILQFRYYGGNNFFLVIKSTILKYFKKYLNVLYADADLYDKDKMKSFFDNSSVLFEFREPFDNLPNINIDFKDCVNTKNKIDTTTLIDDKEIDTEKIKDIIKSLPKDLIKEITSKKFFDRSKIPDIVEKIKSSVKNISTDDLNMMNAYLNLLADGKLKKNEIERFEYEPTKKINVVKFKEFLKNKKQDYNNLVNTINTPSDISIPNLLTAYSFPKLFYTSYNNKNDLEQAFLERIDFTNKFKPEFQKINVKDEFNQDVLDDYGKPLMTRSIKWNADMEASLRGENQLADLFTEVGVNEPYDNILMFYSNKSAFEDVDVKNKYGYFELKGAYGRSIDYNKIAWMIKHNEKNRMTDKVYGFGVGVEKTLPKINPAGYYKNLISQQIPFEYYKFEICPKQILNILSPLKNIFEKGDDKTFKNKGIEYYNAKQSIIDFFVDDYLGIKKGKSRYYVLPENDEYTSVIFKKNEMAEALEEAKRISNLSLFNDKDEEFQIKFFDKLVENKYTKDQLEKIYESLTTEKKLPDFVVI